LESNQTIRALKNTPGLSHISIIFATGDLYSDTIPRMLEAGANTFLKKPIDHIAPQKAIMDRILEKALVG
jgi:CheY-like chemotaxis protein